MNKQIEVSKAQVQELINRVKEKGWTQGTNGMPDGPNCLLGHIFLVSPENVCSVTPLEKTINDKLRKTIISWNDTQGRTVEDVLKLLIEIRDECPT